MPVSMVKRTSTTYAGRSVNDLAEGVRLVRAAPFYPVPTSPWSTSPAVSDFTFECDVIGTSGEMVTVRFRDMYVGSREQVFYPRELHSLYCICVACRGEHYSGK